jgi:hypothetical protein
MLELCFTSTVMFKGTKERYSINCILSFLFLNFKNLFYEKMEEI